ncbi:MAG TPA: radical SAM protein [Ignavibacteriaceae bacterium]
MRILLISPTALDFYGNPIKQGRIHLPGLTLPMLAAVTPPEVELKLIMETTQDIPFNEHWDAVGLTGMGSGIVRAWQIASIFKENKVKVIIGGIAASLADPELILKHCDALVIGEAEELWALVIEDLQRGTLKRIYKSDHRPDIENLPVPRYDLIRNLKIGLWRPVQATRGCPFTCNFCSVASFSDRNYRKKPIHDVIRDVRAAKKYGTKYIAFIDDNICVDLDYCHDLFENLIEEKIIWMSQSSLHLTEHPELVKLAYKSGCRILSIGIESLNKSSLEQIDKNWNNPERYASAFKVLRNNGIDVSTEMIIGLDGDDDSVFQNTYNFIVKNKISIPRVHIITPVPGTQLFERMLSDNRITSQDFGRYSGGKVNFIPKNIKAEILQKGYWSLYKELFSWHSILKRIFINEANLDPYMQAVVWAVNLRYKYHVHHRICPGIV